jgi:hypothetical protein
VLDLLALRERYGEAIISLCGNHELPHLYGFVLGKGAIEYTPGFEKALSQSGHTVVAQRHLRLASGAHAQPRTAGQYLVFDAARRIDSIEDVHWGLQSVF